jgi:three-Cys-motif partner protein
VLLPKEYIGRPQAFLKHTILKTYIERLFMIIGQSEIVINYVDCFAGPWSDENEALTDTSIGISIAQMRKSVAIFKKTFKRDVKFRALYIEKDNVAFARLQEFLNKHRDPAITVACMHGDYTKLIPHIMEWTQEHFTFFFVDPKGWKNIIGATTMKLLLERPKTEFLINLMYDFANRATGIEKHDPDMIELLGAKPNYDSCESVFERQQAFLSQYQNNVNSTYFGRSTYVPINRPGTNKLLYFLVYLTRHPKGIIVFKDAAEKMMLVQRITHNETLLLKQFEAVPITDLFAADEDATQCIVATDNRLSAKEFLLKKLTHDPLLIDNECFAKFLEESDLYPTDFQQAMKQLIDKKLVANLDADVGKRRTKFIQPDWPQKSERWQLLRSDD